MCVFATTLWIFCRQPQRRLWLWKDDYLCPGFAQRHWQHNRIITPTCVLWLLCLLCVCRVFLRCGRRWCAQTSPPMYSTEFRRQTRTHSSKASTHVTLITSYLNAQSNDRLTKHERLVRDLLLANVRRFSMCSTTTACVGVCVHKIKFWRSCRSEIRHIPSRVNNTERVRTYCVLRHGTHCGQWLCKCYSGVFRSREVHKNEKIISFQIDYEHQ